MAYKSVLNHKYATCYHLQQFSYLNCIGSGIILAFYSHHFILISVVPQQ